MIGPSSKRLEDFIARYFNEHPVDEIKSINRITPDIEATLSSLAPLVARNIDSVIEKFYAFVLGNPRSLGHFSGPEQIRKLQGINRKSFVKIFSPPFDEQYFAYRLRVGYMHYVIDLSPELYVGAIGVLESALGEVWDQMLSDPEKVVAAREATSRMLKTELQLTLDTYFTLGRQDVESARRRSQEVLDNLNEGFLTIKSDLLVEVASKSCHGFFGDQPEGRSIREIPGIAPEQASFFASGIEQYFENFMPLDVNISLLPKRIQSSLGRLLEFRYTPIVDNQEQPIKLVVTVQDVTEAVQKALQLEQETQLNRSLIHILRHKDAFAGFLDDTFSDLNQLASCNDEAVGKRILHTLKGNSAAFGLLGLTKLVHGIETGAEEKLQRDQCSIFFSKASDEIKGWVVDFLDNDGAVLEMTLQAGGRSGYQLSAQDFSTLQTIAAKMQPPPLKKSLDEILSSIQLLPMQAFTSTYENVVKRLAEKLGKHAKLDVQGAHLRIDPKRFAPIFKQLVHAIRNALDHGIEIPEEREMQGKSEVATIRVSLSEGANGSTTLVLEDDGRGIDTQKLAGKAVERGLIAESWLKAAPRSEVLKLIFADGLSTADQITDTSGRGVGMSALKAEVEAQGGSLDIWSEKGQGTKIILTFGSRQFQRKAV